MKWRDLTIEEKAKIIKLGTSNGLYKIKDIKDMYNSSTKKNDAGYYDWMEKEATQNSKNWGMSTDEALTKMLNDNEYNYREAYKNRTSKSSNNHYPDKYKTAYHPTFSNESVYSGKRSQYNPDGIIGGSWGNKSYNLSQSQKDANWNIERTQNYLNIADPGYKVYSGGGHVIKKNRNKFDKGGSTTEYPQLFTYNQINNLYDDYLRINQQIKDYVAGFAKNKYKNPDGTTKYSYDAVYEDIQQSDLDDTFSWFNSGLGTNLNKDNINYYNDMATFDPNELSTKAARHQLKEQRNLYNYFKKDNNFNNWVIDDALKLIKEDPEIHDLHGLLLPYIDVKYHKKFNKILKSLNFNSELTEKDRNRLLSIMTAERVGGSTISPNIKIDKKYEKLYKKFPGLKYGDRNGVSEKYLKQLNKLNTIKGRDSYTTYNNSISEDFIEYIDEKDKESYNNYISEYLNNTEDPLLNNIMTKVVEPANKAFNFTNSYFNSDRYHNLAAEAGIPESFITVPNTPANKIDIKAGGLGERSHRRNSDGNIEIVAGFENNPFGNNEFTIFPIASVLSHEMTHASPLFNTGSGNGVSEESPYYGKDYSKVPQKWKELLTPDMGLDDLNDHDSELNEQYSDLMAFRTDLYLYSNGKWDYRDPNFVLTQDMLDEYKKHLAKQGKSNRFLKYHSDEKTLRALKDIAKAGPNNNGSFQLNGNTYLA